MKKVPLRVVKPDSVMIGARVVSLNRLLLMPKKTNVSYKVTGSNLTDSEDISFTEISLLLKKALSFYRST